MPKQQNPNEKVNFDAVIGSRTLGTVAAKRAGFANLSDFLRQALYDLIEEQIPLENERKQILELLTKSSVPQDDDETISGGDGQPFMLDPERVARVRRKFGRDPVTGEKLSDRKPGSEKTGTG